MSYCIIPQSGEEWGFHKEKTEKQGMGNGRRTRAEQRRGKGAVIKDKRKISSKECIDVQFTFIAAGGRWILRRLYHSHHFLNKYTYPAAPQTDLSHRDKIYNKNVHADTYKQRQV